MNSMDQVKKQIEDKMRIKEMEKQLMLVERDAFGRVITQNQIVEEAIKGDKRAKQQMYRDLLNTQMQYQKELRGYGNMTELEKKINRVDLMAYKNYDNKMYSLVPGINSQLNEDAVSVTSKYPRKQKVDPDENTSPQLKQIEEQ